MTIDKKLYGYTPEGERVDTFTLSNSKGSTAEIINYGGIVVSLKVPDRDGKFEDVVLGVDNLEGYLKNDKFFGAIIGRFGNRIEDARFELNGVEYKLAKNDGENTLHGGIKGFDKVVWQAEIVEKEGLQCLELTYLSKDGEEGYPGNLDVKVTYTLTEDNALKIDYFAVSDKDTVINLTNHSYFNLAGHNSGTVLNHKLMINSDKITAANKESIPTGEIRDVKGTPMDFTSMKAIGQDINADYDQLRYGGGYDHNWILNVSGKAPEKAAEVYDEKSGRVMEVYTTKPGVQLYTANFLNGRPVGKGGAAYGKRSALCLETQFFPNSIKHKHFSSPILRAGEEYKHTTIYKFSVR
ncbi:MAG: aldose epimerase family protein [Bacillota bacterium]|nr:aldose epimerase family protein [Bacillota bacterium]